MGMMGATAPLDPEPDPDEPVPPACSAYPACSGLGFGNCCPQDNGISVACCQDTPYTSCNLYSSCTATGKTGVCCPNQFGEWEDCCFALAPPSAPVDPPVDPPIEPEPIFPPLCKDNPACVSLDGPFCRPTLKDANPVYLDCCWGVEPENPTEEPKKPPAACINYPLCAHLTGPFCCPTPGSEGDFLDCCFGIEPELPLEPEPEQPIAFPRECKDHPLCAAENLTGFCCPTSQPDKKMLDCCEGYRN